MNQSPRPTGLIDLTQNTKRVRNSINNQEIKQLNIGNHPKKTQKNIEFKKLRASSSPPDQFLPTNSSKNHHPTNGHPSNLPKIEKKIKTSKATHNKSLHTPSHKLPKPSNPDSATEQDPVKFPSKLQHQGGKKDPATRHPPPPLLNSIILQQMARQWGCSARTGTATHPSYHYCSVYIQSSVPCIKIKSLLMLGESRR